MVRMRLLRVPIGTASLVLVCSATALAATEARFDKGHAAVILSNGKTIQLSSVARPRLPVSKAVRKGHASFAFVASTATLSSADTIVNASVFGGFPANSPSVAVDPNDPSHVFASANDYRYGGSQAGLYSAVAGSGFTDTIEQYVSNGDGAYQVSGDAAVGIDRHGIDYLASIAFDRYAPHPRIAVIVARSMPIDGGRYVEDPPTVVDRHGTNLIDDNDSLAVDAVDGSAYEDSVYSAFTRFDESDPAHVIMPIVAAYSRDGVVFSRTVPVSKASATLCPGDAGACSHNQGSAIAIGPHGALYIAYENYDTGSSANQILLSTSYDGGKTYGAPSRVALVNDFQGVYTPLVVHSYPSLAVSRKTGALYVAWTDRLAAGSTEGIEIATSSNPAAGKWSVPVAASVPLAGAFRFFPAVSVATISDNVYVSYYDNARAPRSSSWDYVYRRFAPALLASSATTRVSTTPIFPYQGYLTGVSFGDRSSSSPTPTGARVVWTGSALDTLDIESAQLQ